MAHQSKKTNLSADALKHTEMMEDFIDIVDGDVPNDLWDGKVTFVGQEGELFHYHVELAGGEIKSFTSSRSLDRKLGDCYVHLFGADSIQTPTSDSPVQITQNQLNLESHDNLLTKQLLTINNELRASAEDYRNLLVLKKDDGFEFFPISGPLGELPDLEVPVEALPAGELGPMPPVGGETPGVEYHEVPTLTREGLLTSMNISAEPQVLEVTGLSFEGPFAVLYFPALECESGPQYSVQTISVPAEGLPDRLNKRSSREINKVKEIINVTKAQYENKIVNLENEVKKLKEKLEKQNSK